LEASLIQKPIQLLIAQAIRIAEIRQKLLSSDSQTQRDSLQAVTKKAPIDTFIKANNWAVKEQNWLQANRTQSQADAAKHDRAETPKTEDLTLYSNRIQTLSKDSHSNTADFFKQNQRNGDEPDRSGKPLPHTEQVELAESSFGDRWDCCW
jgi:hypothetical protein